MTDEIRFYVLIAWMLVWKGIALWKAARDNQKIWFILIFAFPFNTFGVLEIIYIFWISKVLDQGLASYIEKHLPWSKPLLTRAFPTMFTSPTKLATKTSKKH